MVKNEIVELEIIDMGSSFEGIAKKDGEVVFVPGAIKGEKIQAKIIKKSKDYSIAKIENILTYSKVRENPICDVYKLCGGCSSMHVDYNFSLEQKYNMVKNLLKKSGLDEEVTKLSKTLGMGIPYYYRNKVQYPVRVDKSGKNILGFYQKRSHEIVCNDCCYIQNRVIDITAKSVFDIITKLGFSGYNEKVCEGDIRNIIVKRGYHTGEIMVVIVANNKNILKNSKVVELKKQILKLNENIKSIFFNINTKNTNEILGDENYKIYGEDYIIDNIGEFSYYISPKSFFQVNTLQAEFLYQTLKENLKLNGNEIIFDLYSGVGSIGIFLSDMSKMVYGIEIEEEAVKMAKLNMQKNNVKNAEYVAGSVEEKIVDFENRKISPDVIVVDPPRKGLDTKSIDYILNFKPKKIGYVSCNPATLVRDLKLLGKNYIIESIVPVDMFPHTSSVECCSVLYLKDSIQ